MNIHRSILILFLIVFGFSGPALAHSFNVALVLPASNPEAKQFHMGFLLAARQRDAHADETADGHLGGLDVYINVVSEQAVADNTDIVVDFTVPQGSDTASAIWLQLGQSPFAQIDRPDVTRFISSYKAAYGTAPSTDAAQGYNAAWRIAVAVRAQGGVEDKAMLLQSFSNTAQDFTW
jgi:hypothetical protein